MEAHGDSVRQAYYKKVTNTRTNTTTVYVEYVGNAVVCVMLRTNT